MAGPYRSTLCGARSMAGRIHSENRSTQQGRGHHPKTVVEVAAEVRLRDLFGLSDGAEVELDFLR